MFSLLLNVARDFQVIHEKKVLCFRQHFAIAFVSEEKRAPLRYSLTLLGVTHLLDIPFADL